MTSVHVAGVLQEAGYAISRAGTKCQVYVEYFIIPYTFTFIRLSHLYQEFCAHYVVIITDGGMVDSYQGVSLVTRGGYYLRVCFFLLVLLSFGLSCCLSFFKWLEHDSCCVCFCVILFVFFISGRINWELLRYRNCCVSHAKLFEKWVSDHFYVDLLGKGRVF